MVITPKDPLEKLSNEKFREAIRTLDYVNALDAIESLALIFEEPISCDMDTELLVQITRRILAKRN